MYVGIYVFMYVGMLKTCFFATVVGCSHKVDPVVVSHSDTGGISSAVKHFDALKLKLCVSIIIWERTVR